MKRHYMGRDKFNTLKKDFPTDIDFDDAAENPSLIIRSLPYFPKIMHSLNTQHKFDMLSNITAVDYNDYFEVVYDLTSRINYEELMVKVPLAKASPALETVTALWPEADFQEREQYDLMGIIFLHHPNLQRILLPDDFIGYPLQKSYRQAEKEGENG